MKYKIIKNIKNNFNKYECIIIIINKKYNNKKFFYKNIKKKYYNKYNFVKNKKNINKYFNTKSKQDLYLIKLKKNKKINFNNFKKIIINTIKIINNNKYTNIVYIINKLKIKNIYWKIFNIINIIENYKYKFNKFKKIKKKKNNKIILFNIKKNEKYISKKAIYNSLIISKGIKKTKDLCNMPSNICNSDYILKKSKKEIYGKNIKISFLNKKKMKTLGMNAYLSVNQGSSNKIRMIKIKYNNNINEKPIVLIGKGITFDSGGISIKSSINMHKMKYDMSGAAVVWGIMYIINKLKLKLNIIGILSCAENMPDSKSVKPGDIIKTLSGKTIEIVNTDAEGRLILCDTLTYIKKYNPQIVISIATLTGTCIISLGKKISALITNNKNLSKKLLIASKKTQDKIWELPLFKKYNKYIISNIADLKNCNENNNADTIIAACFLHNFIKKYKWAHLDIAGTAWNKNKATGRTVYLIIKFLNNYKKKINKNIYNNNNEKFFKYNK